MHLPEHYRLFTTITDPAVASATELAAAYVKRWEIELAFDERDNVNQAYRHGVRSIAEPGGSIRSNDIRTACEEHGITLIHTGIRLFHH